MDPQSEYAIMDRAVSSPLDRAVDDEIARHNAAFMESDAFKEMERLQNERVREWEARQTNDA
jgi:hypothetical protein